MTPRARSVTGRAVTAVRQLMVRATVIDQLPAQGWTRPVRELRARALVEQHPQLALRTMAPVVRRGNPTRAGWAAVVRAHERAGDHEQVWESATAALDAGRSSTGVLIAAAKAAEALQDDLRRRGAYVALAESRPRHVRDLVDTATLLVNAESLDGAGGLALMDSYRARVSHGGSGLSRAKVDAHLRALDLATAHARGAKEFTAKVERVWLTPDGPSAVLRQLTRQKSWGALADYAERAEREGVLLGSDAERLGLAAGRASARGHISPALALVDLATRHGSPPADAATLRVECTDQVHFLASGLGDLPSDRVPHTSRPGATLAVLGQSLPLRSGGYATRSHGILTSLKHHGWDVAAVTKLGFPYDFWSRSVGDGPVKPVDVVDGVPYHRNLIPGHTDYPRYPLVKHVLPSADGIVSVAQAHGAGVIHAASLFDVGLAGAVAAERLGVPFVYEMRGLKQLLEGARYAGFETTERGRYFDGVELEVAKRADRLFVITAALGEFMADLGVDADKIGVVPNGVHTASFRPLPRDEDLAHRLGVGDKTVIGYVGGLVHYEGLELLLQAAAALRRTRTDFHVLIVGDGAHSNQVTREASRQGLTDDVLTMTGRVPHHEVERYLSLVDITPFPRVPMPVSELISPIKPFEAMATAKAVVVSDVAALTEIVIDGETGRHFRKGHADDLAAVLHDLLDDPAERERLGGNARRWVCRERDWETVTAEVDRTYRGLGLAPAQDKSAL